MSDPTSPRVGRSWFVNPVTPIYRIFHPPINGRISIEIEAAIGKGHLLKLEE